MMDKTEKELKEFVAKKCISTIIFNRHEDSVRYGVQDDNAFDLVFDDGTSLELYVIDNKLGWVIVDEQNADLRE